MLTTRKCDPRLFEKDLGGRVYIVTGAAYGVLFHLTMSLWFSDASPAKRFLVGGVVVQERLRQLSSLIEVRGIVKVKHNQT